MASLYHRVDGCAGDVDRKLDGAGEERKGEGRGLCIIGMGRGCAIDIPAVVYCIIGTCCCAIPSRHLRSFPSY